MVICWYRSGRGGAVRPPSTSLLLIPLAYAVVWSTQFYAKSLTDQLRLQHGVRPTRPRPRGSPSRRPGSPPLLTLPNDYGLLCLAFATIGVPVVFTPLYLLLLVASTLFLAASLRRWSRELRAHGRDDG